MPGGLAPGIAGGTGTGEVRYRGGNHVRGLVDVLGVSGLLERALVAQTPRVNAMSRGANQGSAGSWPHRPGYRSEMSRCAAAALTVR
jgi:hypothetical protein